MSCCARCPAAPHLALRPDEFQFFAQPGSAHAQLGHFPAPDRRNTRHGQSAEDVALRAARALQTYLAAQHAQTAALIVEPPVQAAGAMAMYHPRFLREARTLCDRDSVHLIADEMERGFLHSHSHTGIALACRAALAVLAVLDIFGRDDVIAANRAKSSGSPPQSDSYSCCSRNAYPVQDTLLEWVYAEQSSR